MSAPMPARMTLVASVAAASAAFLMLTAASRASAQPVAERFVESPAGTVSV